MGEKQKFPPAIGIDLGTTFCCAAVVQKGKVDVIPNDQGGRLTPSCVAFTGDHRLIGAAAMLQRAKNPTNTIFDAKRLVGRTFKDPSVQADRNRWAFEIVDHDGKLKISVNQGKRYFFPEEISATVLEHIKQTATDYIGQDISSAVITVPAYFNDAQRRATKDAAEIAGLHVLAILNEPTSAAIAYGLEKEENSARNVLIFDLGGGTFDVTVLTIGEGVFDVKSTDGNTHLGGQDFNDRLYNHFVALFSQKHGLDLTKNDRSKYRLRAECEKTKKMLSASAKTSFYIDSLFNGIDFEGKITRATFEQLNHDLFTATMETVETALQNANMDKDMIDDVVLVGGSTRIPYIKGMLKEYFGELKICESVNPDEAVACGAALRAAFLTGDVTAEMKLRDVTPLSLGVEVRGKEMSFLIMRNTKIPAKKWEVYKTSSNFQTTVEIRVFEGERSMTKLNNLLGSFQLHDIPPMPAGEARIHVCFDIDSNGVLEVSGVEKSTGKENKIKIKQDRGRMSDEEIKNMISDAEKFRKQDEEWKNKRDALNAFETLVSDTKYNAESVEGGTKAETKKNEYIAAECEELLEWAEDNRTASTEDIRKKKEDLQKKLSVLYTEEN